MTRIVGFAGDVPHRAATGCGRAPTSERQSWFSLLQSAGDPQPVSRLTRTAALPRGGRAKPQQLLAPHVVSFESMPLTGLSVMRTEPVSLNPAFGFVPSLANATIASTPSVAILVGNCITVAPMMPSLTFLTPVHEPSIDPIRMSFCLPAALIAA